MPAIPVTRKAATSDAMCTLRVYGGKNVAGPGVLYKSIVINQRSTAAEVIDLTLNRYSSNAQPWEFELRYVKTAQQKRKGFHLFKQKPKPTDIYTLSAADCKGTLLFLEDGVFCYERSFLWSKVIYLVLPPNIYFIPQQYPLKNAHPVAHTCFEYDGDPVLG